MNNKIKLMIADDHVLFMEGLIAMLKGFPEISIAGTANNGKELLNIIKTETADVILIDINMPEMNGIDAIRYIRQSNTGIKIIILSSYQEDHLIEKAKQMGVNGYLPKNVNKEDLVQAIHLVQQGITYFPFKLPDRRDLISVDDSFLKQFNLTAREKELLQLIKDGDTNKEVAGKLNLSIYTVETHRKNIMQKLKLKKPSQLIRFIIQNNI